MMKDRFQKQKLLKYFISRGWFAKIEVNINNQESISQKSKMITDIDVLSLFPEPNGKLSLILGDCKTLKNQSPINRAFWLKGLMEYLNANQGIILLEKEIEGEHKLIANDVSISMLSENDFEKYSNAMCEMLSQNDSAILNMDNWDVYFDLPKKYLTFDKIFHYVNTTFWNEKDYGDQIRHILNIIIKQKQEFNPENNCHCAILLDLACLFSIALNSLIIHVFNKYLIEENKVDFDKELKILLWGGFEKYTFLNDLRKKVPTMSNSQELSLPEWDLFIQLTRTFIEKPLSTSNTPLILEECLFQLLQDKSLIKNDLLLKKLLKTDTCQVRNIIMIIEYLVKATNLPKEFIKKISEFIFDITR